MLLNYTDLDVCPYSQTRKCSAISFIPGRIILYCQVRMLYLGLSGCRVCFFNNEYASTVFSTLCAHFLSEKREKVLQRPSEDIYFLLIRIQILPFISEISGWMWLVQDHKRYSRNASVSKIWVKDLLIFYFLLWPGQHILNFIGSRIYMDENNSTALQEKDSSPAVDLRLRDAGPKVVLWKKSSKDLLRTSVRCLDLVYRHSTRVVVVAIGGLMATFWPKPASCFGRSLSQNAPPPPTPTATATTVMVKKTRKSYMILMTHGQLP